MATEKQQSPSDELALQRLNQLLELLSRQGFSQGQIAAKACLPAQYLSDIKHARRPLTELVARRLGEEFQTNFQWLLGTSNEMEIPRPHSSKSSVGSSISLPVFSHPIEGEPRAQPDWDGTTVEVAGVAAAKSALLEHPYVLRFGHDDNQGRLRKGDLILISQAIDKEADIQVVVYRKRLFLARRSTSGDWIRVANGNEMPADSPVAGHCVGIIWSPL